MDRKRRRTNSPNLGLQYRQITFSYADRRCIVNIIVLSFGLINDLEITMRQNLTS